MKVNRILAAVLIPLLLLTGCQTPPEDSPLPPDAPEETGTAGRGTGAAKISDPSNPPPPGSGWDSRPLRLADEITVVSIPETPDTASFSLTYWDPAYEDGQVLLVQSCYTQSDRDALTEALPEVRGWAIEEDRRVLVNESLPIYGLRIEGVEEDFEAVCQGRLWLDNQGHVLSLRDEPALPALWERFAREPRERDLYLHKQNLYFLPALRELALSSGTWDPRFLVPADHPVSEAVSMELTSTESGLDWTVANGLGVEIHHGNGSHAVPEVLQDGQWYKVPTFTAKHYAWTLEAYMTRPGETYSGTLWQEPYGILPDGEYRLAFDVSPSAAGEIWAAAPFSIQNGQFLVGKN